nr:voltage-dependent T-type calcium channel subunit alpha-1G-like [Nothobranchius furzeri]
MASSSSSEPLRVKAELWNGMKTMVNTSFWDLLKVLVILTSIVSVSMYSPIGEEPQHLRFINLGCICFFIFDMFLKMASLGICRERGHLRSIWNRVELFVLIFEIVDCLLFWSQMHLRISYPLKVVRLIIRVRELRRWIKTVVKIIPIIAEYILMYLSMVYIFGTMGVQLWAGDLHHRCYTSGLDLALKLNMSEYYQSSPDEFSEFLCSPNPDGIRQCKDIPPLRQNGQTCMLAPPSANWSSALLANSSALTNSTACINWNVLYNACLPLGPNPGFGGISFDNVGYGMLTVYQVTTLEGWTTIMNYVMDVSFGASFLIFFILVGSVSFLAINTFQVIVAIHFVKADDDDEPERERGFFVDGLDLLYRMKLYLWEHRCVRLSTESDRWWSSQSRSRSFDAQSPTMEKIERFLNSDLLGWIQTLTILANLIAMSIEHYGQPEALTTALDTCNCVFIGMYSAELVVNVLLYRIEYFTDWENVVDLAIIIIGIVEIVWQTETRLYVLRAFRATRISMLSNFSPKLKRQWEILKRSIRQSLHLSMMFFFIVYIFSMWGMTLFSSENFPPREVRGLFHPQASFDSLWWSMLTVFQIITGDSWNVIMYSAMLYNSPYIALYFITVITIGKDLLLSFLVGMVMLRFDRTTSSSVETDSSRSESRSDPLSASSGPPTGSPSGPTPQSNGSNGSWPSMVRVNRCPSNALRCSSQRSSAGFQSCSEDGRSPMTRSSSKVKRSPRVQGSSNV